MTPSDPTCFGIFIRALSNLRLSRVNFYWYQWTTQCSSARLVFFSSILHCDETLLFVNLHWKFSFVRLFYSYTDTTLLSHAWVSMVCCLSLGIGYKDLVIRVPEALYWPVRAQNLTPLTSGISNRLNRPLVSIFWIFQSFCLVLIKMSETWPLIGGLCVLITKCLSPLHFRQCDAQVRRPHLKVYWHAYIKMIHL